MRKYAQLKIVETISDCDGYDEDKYVLKYMERYGMENVRGGSFSQIKLTDEQKRCIKRMIKGAEDRCFRCRKMGHFIKDRDGIVPLKICNEYDGTKCKHHPEDNRPTKRNKYDVPAKEINSYRLNLKNKKKQLSLCK